MFINKDILINFNRISENFDEIIEYFNKMVKL